MLILNFQPSHWLAVFLLLYFYVPPTFSIDFIRQYHTFPHQTARPKFIVQPESQEVDNGSRVQFRCAGEASPQPLLYWYKEGHRQLMFAPSSSSSTSSSSSSSSHLAKDSSWLPQAAPLVASAQDFRYGSSSSASDISPSINKLFTMPINPDQLSNPNFSNLYFNDRIYVDSQGTLNIINATSSDNGFYACALISSVGSVMAKAKLTVRKSSNVSLRGPDQFDLPNPQDYAAARTSSNVPLNSKFDLLPPPVIKLGAANQTLPTNTSATLACEVVSQVAYKITWLFESQPLQEDGTRVVVLESGALNINELRPSDSGLYTCVVTAAADQALSVATPFEPLDSSMLTSAPPTPQSTSHSTSLKVASPLNPNIQFYRMDNFAYPSSPGVAYLVTTNGNDAITIAWSPPADSGSLPIKDYVVEHYDTSQDYMGWTVIYRIKGRESLLIDGLSPDGSHFFVIRAANSRGTGPSSPIAGPIRTSAGEAKYQAEVVRRRLYSDSKFSGFDSPINSRPDISIAWDKLKTISTTLLNLTPVSSTSIKLQWSIQNNASLLNESEYPLHSSLETEHYLEGYSIRYRPIGVGESLLGREPFIGSWNAWATPKDLTGPSSLPLVTSYLDPREESVSRYRRDLNSYDNSLEFNEVRVVDHETEFYTINRLRPFTQYQFFVVPYYKDIDGVPSNILTAQTNEDKPSVAPHLIVRPLNNTSVRLLWLHVPPVYANGILRGYVVQTNRSQEGSSSELSKIGPQANAETTKIINLPLGSLTVAALNSLSSDNRVHMNGFQQYVVMYDMTNLTHKSFYSVQVAATTSAGYGPWSDPQNFIMDPKVLSQPKNPASDFDDVMSKSLISIIPQTHSSVPINAANTYLMLSIMIIILCVFLIAGYVLYYRNNQKVITWKKTISEHLTNKFYIPTSTDPRVPNSLQQNIYDHQQHLIYSGSTHVIQQPMTQQALWSNNGCINSSGTSISSHGGLLQINNDPSNLSRRVNANQIVMMPGNDGMSDLTKNNVMSVIPGGMDPNRPMGHHSQIIHHGGDYYSVINNMAEYEELDTQQRNGPLINNHDRQLTASSNSDNSCPSSVTRLIPNQNMNRELLTSKTLTDNHRHDLILQQQVGCNYSRHEPMTMHPNDCSAIPSMVPLSPYATTNLIKGPMSNQKHLFNNQPNMNQMNRQNNFTGHSGGMTMDDTSKILMGHQQINGPVGLSGLFRTLQRSPASNLQPRTQHQFSPTTSNQVFVQQHESARLNEQMNSSNKFQGQQQNHQLSHMNDPKTNLYEHIDYSGDIVNQQQQQQPGAIFQNNSPRLTNGVMSSSTSSGSVKSSNQAASIELQSAVGNKHRRGSSQMENETHDMRVFAKPPVITRQQSNDSASTSDRIKCEPNQESDDREDEDSGAQIDETTAFRQKINSDTNQRSRQLSKRRRQQQRNRLHNNNQKGV